MSRVQLALNVSDIDEAVAFYSKLFATEPAKRKPGYANFAIAEPPLKLVLIEGDGGGTLNHLGVEVETSDEVEAAQGRLADDGVETPARTTATAATPAGQDLGRRPRRGRGRSTWCSATATIRHVVGTSTTTGDALCCASVRRRQPCRCAGDGRRTATAAADRSPAVWQRGESPTRPSGRSSSPMRSAPRSSRPRVSRAAGRTIADRRSLDVPAALAGAPGPSSGRPLLNAGAASCCSAASPSTCSNRRRSSWRTSGSGSTSGRRSARTRTSRCWATSATRASSGADPSVRLYRTRARQDFHTDGADLVGLLCLHGRDRGGESRIASSAAVYNEILRRRPDLLDVLYEPFAGTATTSSPPAKNRSSRCPSSATSTATPRVFYIGWYIRDAQRHPSGAAAHRGAARGDGPGRVHRQRPGVPPRDGLPARRRPAAQQRPDPPLPRGLRGRRRARAPPSPAAAVAHAPTTSRASRGSCREASRASARRDRLRRCRR